MKYTKPQGPKRKIPIFDKEDRPQFERMIDDLNRARQQWDNPILRDYSRVLLQLVGTIALAESSHPCEVHPCETPVVIKWPETEIVTLARDLAAA